MTLSQFDLAIVGAGIVGLAHALAAARKGMRVVVVERDLRANGASVRNFGFVTVTGQQQGECWRRARRSRDVWQEIAPQAGIDIEQRGLALVARRAEAVQVLEAFLRTEMGASCELLDAIAARRRFPQLQGDLQAVMWSREDLRVESRSAIPRLAAWLRNELDVTFIYGTSVYRIDLPTIDTSRGEVRAKRCVVCSGDDFATLLPERHAAHNLRRCKLQMLRLTPRSPMRLPMAVMSDLSLVRYLGYAELPEAKPLLARLRREQPEHLAAGVHLIVVQSADGSLIVGDTHVYGDAPDPFSDERLDGLVLAELEAVFPQLGYTVHERWLGTYASAEDKLAIIDSPCEGVRLVLITSGTGASTAFALAEETLDQLAE